MISDSRVTTLRRQRGHSRARPRICLRDEHANHQQFERCLDRQRRHYLKPKHGHSRRRISDIAYGRCYRGHQQHPPQIVVQNGVSLSAAFGNLLNVQNSPNTNFEASNVSLRGNLISDTASGASVTLNSGATLAGTMPGYSHNSKSWQPLECHGTFAPPITELERRNNPARGGPARSSASNRRDRRL